MGTVLLIAVGVLCFVTGPALVLVIVQAVRSSARAAAAPRQPVARDAERIPVPANYAQRR
ncbi:hypothetical protein GPX89_04765 [Nocardia sp. ET3-3]|uniref:Uncharacterized protein n=1 Tax=Nocardia terrae TaxID=2675851 RepID=A0A7K1UQF4_9NOCA|nr:hypothetical protein [Nocardia terrae]MVU76554.1 hypothetical protein [Nocardia terrae]